MEYANKSLISTAHATQMMQHIQCITRNAAPLTEPKSRGARAMIHTDNHTILTNSTEQKSNGAKLTEHGAIPQSSQIIRAIEQGEQEQGSGGIIIRAGYPKSGGSHTVEPPGISTHNTHTKGKQWQQR